MLNTDASFYALAFSKVQGVSMSTKKQLIDLYGTAEKVYALRHSPTDVVLQKWNATNQAWEEAFQWAEKELKAAEQRGVSILPYESPNYPVRLRECNDPPPVLYYRGTEVLNARHIISVVGTRRCTDYGAELCRRFISELSEALPEAVIVSGLAYGVDIQAHRYALQYGLPTVGVLAHGLDRIYPSMHKSTAQKMLEQGGLLTEFSFGTFPDKPFFVRRNRVVAGMSDAVIVVESAEKGGALITAELASSYNRDVFAFPGRITDEYSTGCNRLIADNRAALIQSTVDFLAAMRWDVTAQKPIAVQRNLFPDLSPEEQSIVNILQSSPSGCQLNDLALQTQMSVQILSGFLFTLEMQGIITLQAGGVYRLV